jgi:putative transposase
MPDSGSMPWKETDAMKERVKLVLEWERRWDAGEGDVNVAELCREFGISRETGYYWIRRYRAADHDVRAVIERSRRPLTSPSRVDEKLEDFIVETRKLFPKWGPQKLRDYMVRRWPQHAFPSASTMGEILKRRGLTRPRLRRGRASWALTQPFAECIGPNATWCVDFKGHFRTQDGVRCYPLTLIDAHSRYLLRCEGLLEPDGKAVQRIFDTAFTEFGLPAAIRSDNGPPFASVAAAGLSQLSVWWTRLGIRIERIQPGKPQQNGRLERFHRTLKSDAIAPPRANLRAQQRAFDLFRREYNEERPHESLNGETPASAYECSPRPYPRPLLRFEEQAWDRRATVDKDGFISWGSHRVFVTTALRHEDVILVHDDDQWEVKFGPHSLGWLDHPAPRVRGQLARCGVMAKKKIVKKVSGMSSD